MSAVLFYLGWALLLFLLWGGCVITKGILGLKACFSPIVTICAISLVVYFAGIFSYLRPVTCAMLSLCLLGGVYSVIQRKLETKEEKRPSALALLFLLGTVAFMLILARDELVHYDNFTHWGLVVKEMLITHAIPNADSLLIEFNNYPTGTASWIYFVCTLVGHGENSMVMAQGLLIFAALYAVFGIIEERERFLLTLSLGAGLSLLSLFNFSIRINNLLVDFVLPVLALAAIALVYRHRREPNTMLCGLVPILGLLVVVKSTGIIFAVLVLLYTIYTVVRYSLRIARHPWWLLPKFLVSSALALLPFLLWNIHTKLAFAGMSNKFETDLTLVTADVGGKTEEEIRFICQLFWETITDISQRGTMGILLFQGLAIVACIIGCGFLKKKWKLPKVLLVMDLVLVAYLLGILAMYIFSMPMEEAAYLAAFDRYSASIVVLFGGVLSICLTTDMEASFYYRVGEVEEIRSFYSVESKSIYLRSCVGCAVLLLIILTSEYNGMIYLSDQEQDSVSQIKGVLGDSWAEELDESKYLVFASDEKGWVSNYYIEHVCRYYLRANNVDAICLFYEDNFLNLISQYEYLIMLDTSPEAQRLMQSYLGLSGEVGIYDLRSDEIVERQ